MTFFVVTITLLCGFIVFQPRAAAQESVPPSFQPRYTRSEVIRLIPGEPFYQLSNRFILPESEHIMLDTTAALARDTQYELDYSSGRLTIRWDEIRSLVSDTSVHWLTAHYRVLPLTLRPEYYLRRPATLKTQGDGLQAVVQPAQPFSVDELFGSNIQKSGSIVRGFTVGSNRDLSLSSGFRMQLSGDLARDVRIVAALTDENTPLQPEGTTQTLREVDNVFVELNAPGYAATLGDFNFSIGEHRGGEFGQLSRKLQGATGFVHLGERQQTTVRLTGGTQRGKFHSNQFRGQDGNQGPYRLTGRNGERRILIVAGSERVYLNGEQLARGEVQDYTIDYASGEIVFTSRRLITNASRLVVDFEYTDREFTRNLLGGGVSTTLFDGMLELSSHFTQEADDPDAAVEATLDDAAKQRLRESGSNRFAASLPGARYAGVDSSTGFGRGQYVKTDTVINGRPYTVYHFAPGDSLALYALVFSVVDRVPADSAGYERVGIGQFRFAGIGRGNYMPVQFLPMPQRHRMGTLVVRARLADELVLSTEYAASEFDHNRFSTLDDAERAGSAYRVGLRFNPRSLRVGGSDLGELDLSLSERSVNRRFVSFDEINEVEFDRKWNIEQNRIADERIREATLRYQPLNALTLSGGYGSLTRTNIYDSERISGGVVYRDSAQRVLQYHGEDIRTRDFVNGLTSTWTRHRAMGELSMAGLRPGLRVEREERTQTVSGQNILQAGSFAFQELAPRIGMNIVAPFEATAELQLRVEDSVSVGKRERAFASVTQLYHVDVRGLRNLTSSVGLSIRKTEFTEPFRRRGNVDGSVILMRTQTRYTPFDRAVDATVFYEFSNQRSARLERVFIRVPRGTGNYRYLGDLNNNNVADENEFELTRFDGDYIVILTPSEQLVPVLDLKTNFRLRLEPGRFYRRSTSTLEEILAALSTETTVRIEERSKEREARKVYLLHTSGFLNDETTIAGAQVFMQDVHVFEYRSDVSFRFRYGHRKNLLQLLPATERSRGVERSVRLRLQLLPEIGNQTEYRNNLDRVQATARSPRERDLTIEAINTDFSYRPEPAWEVGFRIEVGRVRDRFRAPHAVADLNEQELRVSYSVLGMGQLRAELRREEVVLSAGRPDPVNPFPFEFTNGRVIGRSWHWQLGVEYRVSRHIQLSLRYNGRREGARPVVHFGQVEARAVF